MIPQQNFFESLGLKGKIKFSHGGSQSKGKRKVMRPLESKKPLHLVLRSEKAKGRLSLRTSNNLSRIKGVLFRQAVKFNIRISSYANVGNHLHILLRFTSRKGFQRFLKSITAMIARIVTGAKKGNPFGKFWDALAFTRIISTKREILVVLKYIKANQVEATFGRDAREFIRLRRSDWEERVYKKRR